MVEKWIVLLCVVEKMISERFWGYYVWCCVVWKVNFKYVREYWIWFIDIIVRFLIRFYENVWYLWMLWMIVVFGVMLKGDVGFGGL